MTVAVETAEPGVTVEAADPDVVVETAETGITIEFEPGVPLEFAEPGDVISIAAPQVVVFETVDTGVVIEFAEALVDDVIDLTEPVVIVTGGKGEKGDPGAAGAAGSAPQAYVHDQDVPDSVWSIPHGLGFYPNVTVIDSGGNEVEGDITYVDTMSLLITFTSSFGGNAYVS